jgi:hypothetical protein
MFANARSLLRAFANWNLAPPSFRKGAGGMVEKLVHPTPNPAPPQGRGILSEDKNSAEGGIFIFRVFSPFPHGKGVGGWGMN